MKKESTVYAVVGLVVGILLAGITATYAVNNKNNGVMRMMGMRTETSSQDSMNNGDMGMSEMTSLLKDKKGDDFDKAFLQQMIIHHQGAIEMAKLVQTNAKHAEVKNLGSDILTAQSREIDMMQTWQTDWGYKTTPQSHGMMGM